MKYCWFLNTRCEFKFKGKNPVFGLNDLPIPSIQIHKKKKSELAFALFRSEVLLLILGALMPAIFASVPCSASINKGSAYHFGPVRVRILLAQNRVMADAQVPAQAAVPAAQALVQRPAAPANVDNPQKNPAPLQVLISFLVICSLDCFSFSPIRLRLVIPRGRSLVPFSSLRKLRVSVVLLISLRPPSPVSTRFKLVCHVFVGFASQTPGLCNAINLPSAPLPSLHTFYLSCFVCSASQTPGLCSAFNFPSAPLPSLHTF